MISAMMDLANSHHLTSQPRYHWSAACLLLTVTLVHVRPFTQGASILPSHLQSTDIDLFSSAISGSRKKPPSGPGTRPQPSGPGTRPQPSGPGTRPQPSDELPIKPLVYGDHDSLPSDSDLDPHVLRQVLGVHYDPDFMSVVRPVESIYSPNGTFHYDFKKSMPVGDMPADIRTLTFTLPGRSKKVKVKSKHNRRRIQRYLATYTYCPVLFQWLDLGQRFWPRWIKSGDCRSPHGRSCSIPAGMTCQPQRSTKKTLLWWHCRRKQPCRWITLQYPIIIKCGCQCRTDST